MMLFACQVGSIEGRVAVQHVEAQQAKKFTFKCHRDNNDIYAVNTISFHPECNKAVAKSGHKQT
jgi:RNA:NAD 2'-phosphotransferase (TPT1/KptA family)